MKESNDQQMGGAITIDFKKCPMTRQTCSAACRWFRTETQPREQPHLVCALIHSRYSS